MDYNEWINPDNQPAIRPDSFWQSELNESQWEAVQKCDGPLLVIAGAGSGKTRVLTYKIAYLLEHGYEPWQVLALTFTNKAAREMNERIGRIVKGRSVSSLWSGTFHSIFARILRMECDAIGYHRDFTIYDTTDQRSLLKAIIKEMALDDKVYKPATVAGRISDAKNRLILPDAYASDEGIQRRDQIDNLGELHRVYSAYWQRCRTAEAMDFDDLLLYTYILFERRDDIRLRYVNRFRYILVDEYQDTNYAQHMIISQLTRENHHVCVVGDDAQSIYSFRGANIDNILHFNRQFPEAETVKLERNYRSTQCIVEAANSIIAHNRGQIYKKVYSENSKGEPLTVISASSDKEEATKVSGTIQRLHRNDGLEYSDFAVLYRTNAQSRSFEDVFRERRIPYRIYGGLSFYQRKEIKDVLAYFRLMINLDDEEAFKRIINYPARGIGNTTLQKIVAASQEHNASLWAVTERPAEYGLNVNRGTLSKLESFCSLILEFRAKAQNVSAYEMAKDVVVNAGIKTDLAHEDGPEGQSKRENLEELLGSIATFEAGARTETGHDYIPLNEYLSQVALLTDADQKDDGSPKVTLMTVHAAKGLEFETVFVTGLEEELFPASSALLFPKELEEERRLFYVAVTRAKQYCFLTYAQARFRFGSMEYPMPSSFLREIDQRFVKTDDDNSRATAHGISPNLRAALYGSKPSAPTSDNIFGDKLTDKKQTSQSRYTTTQRPQAPTSFRTPSSRASASTSPTTATRTLRRVNSLPSSPESRAANEAKARQLRVGSVITHDRFGKGSIIGIDGTGDGIKILVDFGTEGKRNLLLKFAKFTIVTP